MTVYFLKQPYFYIVPVNLSIKTVANNAVNQSEFETKHMEGKHLTVPKCGKTGNPSQAPENAWLVWLCADWLKEAAPTSCDQSAKNNNESTFKNKFAHFVEQSIYKFLKQVDST